ncbi:MAG TPA: c-type cytochrome [Anaeromyxobacteraceae bacterium]|jgi:plastocyanin/cytochrome c5|nr:c-type cytochrome [Anaeromyxobacteraceae bacterium]
MRDPAMRPFLLGLVTAFVLEAVVAALVVASGAIDVSAAGAPRAPDRLLAYASLRSIAHHAKSGANPRAHDPAAIEAGLRRYKAVCSACHGAPGAPPERFAGEMHPAPPDLASPAVQAFTDGMLYEAIERGVGSTGMPAFGKTQSPDDIWGIVAFVRQLRALTPEQQAELARGGGQGQKQEQGGGAAPPTAAPGGSHVHQVSISGFQFKPQTLEVHAGDVIEWKNADFTAHTATADDRRFDTGDLPAGASGRVVLKQKGRFPYFCRYHVSMKGVVVVE